jgi:hypothetical protein
LAAVFLCVPGDEQASVAQASKEGEALDKTNRAPYAFVLVVNEFSFRIKGGIGGQRYF